MSVRRVPKKNVKSIVADVRLQEMHRAEAEETLHSAEAAETFLEYSERIPRAEQPFKEKIPWGRLVSWASASLVLCVGAAGLFVYYSERGFLGSAFQNLDTLSKELEDVNLFDSASRKELLKVNLETNKLLAPRSGVSSLRDTVARVFPQLKQGLGVITDFRDLASETISLATAIEEFKDQWTNYTFSQKGSEFISRLERIKGMLEKIVDTNQSLTSKTTKLELPGAVRVPFGLEAEYARDFLESVIAWLKVPGPRHLAVFLENPSELRPGGGFIGSYADVVFENGILSGVNVHDINEPDRELDLKVIPPKPLQGIVTRWRAADANWFFDFSDSAAQTLTFLETSNIYKRKKIVFDGAIGLSASVIGDILAVTGPVQADGTLFSKDNVISEIQRRVVEGRNQGLKEPKEILRILTTALMEKVARLEGGKRKELIVAMENWIRKKDLVFYFKDQPLQSFLTRAGVTGKPFGIPANFYGDYLALAEAAIGDKADFVVAKTLTFESQLQNDGMVVNRLGFSQKHKGDKYSEWWYRTAHRSYLKVFTPLAVKLTAAQGMETVVLAPKVNYEKERYDANQLLAQIESTLRNHFEYPEVESFKESKRNVFGFWMNVPRGETRTAHLEYSRKLPFLPRVGQAYQFVFDKQSGSRGSYRFLISAPPGFRWQENGRSLFEYATDNPDGRITIELTLAAVE